MCQPLILLSFIFSINHNLIHETYTSSLPIWNVLFSQPNKEILDQKDVNIQTSACKQNSKPVNDFFFQN